MKQCWEAAPLNRQERCKSVLEEALFLQHADLWNTSLNLQRRHIFGVKKWILVAALTEMTSWRMAKDSSSEKETRQM